MPKCHSHDLSRSENPLSRKIRHDDASHNFYWNLESRLYEYGRISTYCIVKLKNCIRFFNTAYFLLVSNISTFEF